MGHRDETDIQRTSRIGGELHADSDSDTEPDIDESRIDPELRLRTVRTAASTIAESIRQERKIEKRRRHGLRGTLKGKGTWKLSLKRRKADRIAELGGEGLHTRMGAETTD